MSRRGVHERSFVPDKVWSRTDTVRYVQHVRTQRSFEPPSYDLVRRALEADVAPRVGG